MKEEYGFLLLAGGKSSRMGRDKATLAYGETTFGEVLLQKARKLGLKKQYLSGHEAFGEGVQVVHDRYLDRGPLGGMHAGFLEAEEPYCLVLPVDVPQIPAAVLKLLLKTHFGLSEQEKKKPLLLKHGQRTEPLIGIYPTEMAEMIGAIISEKAAPVFQVLDRRGYLCCEADFSSRCTENINTPQAYEELLRYQEGGEDL